MNIPIVRGLSARYGHWFTITWHSKLAVGAFAEASIAVGVDGDQGDNSAYHTGAVY
ncbi:MAG: hypothetical protein QNL62_15835 [Gammaproteobacteria bacterium]|nr:hypothetical protein [Gammaproteobacteria bacterium]